MRIQFLGTAAAEGIPALFCPCEKCRAARRLGGREVRTRSGALIDGVLKLDLPPDTYHHELVNGLDFSGLEHVLITHSHSDHLSPAELEFARVPYAQKPAQPPLVIHGNEAVHKLIANMLCDAVTFERIKPFETVDIGGYRVTALKAVHAFSEEAMFYHIEKDGASILYAHDTDEFTDEDYAFLAGKRVDIVSLDCTNGALDADYVGHMGIHDNQRVRERLLRDGAADAHTIFVCNHFSHNGVLTYDRMQEMAGEHFIISYDGLTLNTNDIERDNT